MTKPKDTVDSVEFRRAMSHFATGVAVLTTASEGQRFGMTINSLTSVSLDPAQLLVCIRSGSPTGEAIKRAGCFGVSLLDQSQHESARHFVGADAIRFEGTKCTSSHHDVPVVDGALAGMVCEVSGIMVSGDHDIVIGNVVYSATSGGDPLVFFDGRFGGFRAKPAQRALRSAGGSA